MAKRIVWAERALLEQLEILNYWNERNGSKAYSKKLFELFKYSIMLISKYPNIGRPTDLSFVRVKVVQDYLIFYEVKDTEVYILSIWDGRQNPTSKP